MGLPGPGEITQIAFGGTTVAAQFIEGYSLETTADSYTSALGFDVERGSVTKQLTCNVLDYSAYSALNTLMKNRTKSTVTVTYVDAGTNALSNCIIRVTPLVHQVSDACQVFIGASGAAKTGLDAAYGGTTGVWTDLGVTIGTKAARTRRRLRSTVSRRRSPRPALPLLAVPPGRALHQRFNVTIRHLRQVLPKAGLVTFVARHISHAL